MRKTRRLFAFYYVFDIIKGEFIRPKSGHPSQFKLYVKFTVNALKSN